MIRGTFVINLLISSKVSAFKKVVARFPVEHVTTCMKTFAGTTPLTTVKYVQAVMTGTHRHQRLSARARSPRIVPAVICRQWPLVHT